MVGTPPFSLEAEAVEGPRPSFAAGLGDAPPAGDVAAFGAVFLPGRGWEPPGRWVLRDGFPAGPGWGALPPERGPPEWDGRGDPVGAFGAGPDAPILVLVWVGVWLALFTVLPFAVWLVLWVERAEWLTVVPVPAAPGWGLWGCFGAVAFDTVPAPPGRGPLPLGAVGLPDGWEPAAPGADAPGGGT